MKFRLFHSDFLRPIYGAIAIVWLVCITSCGSQPERREMQRVTSPDKRVDAVLVQRGTGATTATPMELYLVSSGLDWRKESPLLRGDKFDGFKIIWKHSRFLEIHYKKGRIFTFTSFWNSSQIQQFQYIVELRLVPEGVSTIE